jgi:hypothetical protein
MTEDLTTAQLVSRYNAMVRSAPDLRLREISSFHDKKTALARCEKVASSIKAREEGMKAADRIAIVPSTRKEIVAAVNNGSNEFGTRPGTFKEKAVAHLLKNLGKAISAVDLSQAVYGRVDATAELTNVVRGIVKTIADKKLGYELLKKGNTYGLHQILNN